MSRDQNRTLQDTEKYSPMKMFKNNWQRKKRSKILRHFGKMEEGWVNIRQFVVNRGAAIISGYSTYGTAVPAVNIE